MVTVVKAGGYTKVAPLAGAWIEIRASAIAIAFFRVAPLAGAWIEIYAVRFHM